MKSTLILKNIGSRPFAEITVQVSYFIKSKASSQVKTQEFILIVEPNQEKRQEVDFGDSAIKELEVLILVQKPKGNIITQKSFLLQDIDGEDRPISFEIDEEIDVDTPIVEAPTPKLVYGRLLDKKGIHNMEDIQVIISAKKEGESDFEPITSVTTEAQGYFSIEYPTGNFTEAVALVGLELAENPIHIKLSEKVVDQSGDPTTVLVFPPRMILIAELKEAVVSTENTQDCGCSANEFGEKRILEEFSFYSLVRTSEPVIKGYVIEDEDEITLEDVLRNLPYSVFEIIEPLKVLPYIARKSPIGFTRAAIGATAARPVTDDDNFLETIKNIKIKKSVLNNFIKDEQAITKDNLPKLFAQNEALIFSNTINDIKPANPKPLGRVELSIDNSIDWDDEPTIYQAVTVAHGHLLQYKSEWIADGYSLGDLLYSLPLAPGQKKQIVVFDWERRESASNSQSIDYEESLFNSLSRDRDILEIAKGTIEENVSGRSSATVKSVAGGIGGAIGSAVFGIAGGYSNARSRASQNSLRQVSSSDQQKLSDRIVQSANAVRSMRSTVIQTVAQGERFEVSSESVANYNHCHALTIQYYEVLRHFKIRQRFAGARECLFVPLLMAQFDLKKSLRWRESLQLALIDRRLAKGFDAGDRILHEWQDSNFPSGTFASESIITAAGVLQIRFVLQRPIDEIVEVDDTDRAPVFPGNQYSSTVWHKKKIGKIISANWQKLTPFLDGISPEEFHKDYLEGATDKDAVFHQMIGEKVAREFIRNLVFDVEDNTGRSIGNIPIDTSITSRYARNGMLRVTLRLNQPTSFARDKFHYLRIKTKITNGSINLGDILPDGSYMTVESGFMRYKTNHFDGFLFKYQDLGDDLTATDGVTIYAGPSSEELKDPRKEDLVVANKLIAHLNDNLEYYHKAIWLNMTAQRRFMLLDGIILNEDEKEKGGGRSVASLVENDLISIVGNSLVFPVAPGLNLNPDFGTKESLTEFYMTAAAEPISVSVPTKGVFAEAVMGKCNSCEKIEEDRFWRWEESPIPDSPTAITPINTDSRRADPGNLQPQTLPNPIVNIQNAPNAPDPSGLSATLGLLGKSDIFKDITGLEGNQKNAMQAFQSSLDAAKTFAQEAGKLEVQKVMEKRLDKAINAIDNDKSLSPEKKAELKEKALNAYMGGGAINESENKDPNNAKFEEGVKMIDTLGKSGVLTPEDVKEAKESLRGKFLEDKTSLSNDEASLAKDFAERGGDVNLTKEESDGTKFNLSSLFGGGSTPASTTSSSVSRISRDVLDSDYYNKIISIIEMLRIVKSQFTQQIPWKLDKNIVFDRLEELVKNPNLINQDDLNLCGPAVFFRVWIERDPYAFALYAIQLFYLGAAKIGKELIKPDSDVVGKDYSTIRFNPANPCPQADWMVMVSLRDDENSWYFDLEGEPSDEESAGTTASELASWLKLTSLYKNIDEDTNTFFNKSLSHILSLNKYFQKDPYKQDIILFINPIIIDPKRPKKGSERHVVLLTSSISFVNGRVKFTCWSWKNTYTCDVEKSDFESSYYGYILASLK